MDNDQQILKEILTNIRDIHTKVERQDQRLSHVEEWLRGSVNTREERAENKAEVRVELRNVINRISSLESNNTELEKRFFQVWLSLGVSIFGFGLGLFLKK